jgi:hypothetical protein
MHRLLSLAVLIALPAAALAHGDADPAGAHLTQYGAGTGPAYHDGAYRVLDASGSFEQSNAVALNRDVAGAFESVTLRCRMRVTKGGDGGAFAFLNTAEYGAQGPAPYVPSWVEPNLRKTFAVGIDVHNPKDKEPFGEWGNYMGLPQREVSLHWDGRELVKRVSESEFRGDWAEVEIDIDHVCGGAEVTVQIGSTKVYDRYFVAELMPYEMRPAFGAGTRADVAAEFDVADVVIERGETAAPRRLPLHVDVFNHVLTDNSKTWFASEVDLPPTSWAFGRIILTLDLHDAGKDWDEWDRNGHLYLVDDEGKKWDIVPFITSYRTECHWKVDVTHFRPLLTGKKTFEIHAGTTFYKNRGYMMSVTLDYHHGDAVIDGRAVEPFSVVPLWHTNAKYQSAENHFRDAFEKQDVEIPADAVAARIATTTTGHSQIGEFTPSEREIRFQPSSAGGTEPHVFPNTLWKTDCYLNPNRPQYGTWKYSRAGWAPGDVVWPWWIDLTPHLQPGKVANFEYVPKPYDFSEYPEDRRPTDKQINAASHVVRSFLILYRAADALVPAPILRVTNVAGDSAAAKAGIKQGDYLASYDGTRIDSIDDLGAAKKVATDAGKERVPVVVYRGSERLDLEITTGQLGVNLSTR